MSTTYTDMRHFSQPKMFPSFSTKDSPHLGAADAKPLSKRLLGYSLRSQATNFINIFWSKLCLYVSFASRMGHITASLFVHVGNIVFLCSEPQMFWIKAWWVIASMQRLQRIIQVNGQKYPSRNAMGSSCSPTTTNLPISSSTFCPCKDPAARFIDVSIPEQPFFHFFFRLKGNVAFIPWCVAFFKRHIAVRTTIDEALQA